MDRVHGAVDAEADGTPRFAAAPAPPGPTFRLDPRRGPL